MKRRGQNDDRSKSSPTDDLDEIIARTEEMKKPAPVAMKYQAIKEDKESQYPILDKKKEEELKSARKKFHKK